jgi:hypothetical protein
MAFCSILQPAFVDMHSSLSMVPQYFNSNKNIALSNQRAKYGESKRFLSQFRQQMERSKIYDLSTDTTR